MRAARSRGSDRRFVAKTAGGIFRPIEQDLKRVEERIRATVELDHPLLGALLQQVMLAPAKRIRPALTIASGRLFRSRSASLEAMAASIEFLHTATLIHDDVIDLADMRRGEPTLATLAGTRAAILVGDYLFAQAAATASQTNNLRIMRLFAESVMTVCRGQIHEGANEALLNTVWDRDRYYRTIDAKTAALFVLACHAGAILGEATLEQTEALRRYGKSVGLAFQIVDDVLDLIGDERIMGKPAGNDLRQGVITLPMIYLRDELPAELLRALALENGSRDDAIQEISAFARTSQGVERAQRDARELVADALAALQQLPGGESRDMLADLAASVTTREA
jgi:geranylgeranyl pyrophosphate synthase